MKNNSQLHYAMQIKVPAPKNDHLSLFFALKFQIS